MSAVGYRDVLALVKGGGSAQEIDALLETQRAERKHNLAVPAVDWRVGLERRAGRIIADERNIIAVMRSAPELQGLVQFNEFAQRVEFSRSPVWRTEQGGGAWLDRDDTALTEWMQSYDIPARRAMIPDCIELAARENTVHPVCEYLDALKWDRNPRLAKWLISYLSAQDNESYLQLIGPKFLISAVARVMNPGCQVDHVLVLEGKQGAGKSQTARALAVKPAWFTDAMPDLHGKDAALQLCGRWFVELAELAALRRSEIEGVKAFITRPTDVFRPPYGRRPVAVPRQSVFIATTNETHYLRDPTGNRRFWPVSCGAIDIDSLERDRDQLYAEAVAAYRVGTAWHLIGGQAVLADAEQRERMMTTELETDVALYLNRQREHGQKEADVRAVLVEALGLEPDASDFTERSLRLGAQVASAMERAGWHKVRRLGRGENRRTVYRYQE